jgi:hypothetical protein
MNDGCWAAGRQRLSSLGVREGLGGSGCTLIAPHVEMDEVQEVIARSFQPGTNAGASPQWGRRRD